MTISYLCSNNFTYYFSSLRCHDCTIGSNNCVHKIVPIKYRIDIISELPKEYSCHHIYSLIRDLYLDNFPYLPFSAMAVSMFFVSELIFNLSQAADKPSTLTGFFIEGSAKNSASGLSFCNVAWKWNQSMIKLRIWVCIYAHQLESILSWKTTYLKCS